MSFEGRSTARYARAVERALSRGAGRPIVISPRDWALCERWAREGVPLAVVVTAIREAMKHIPAERLVVSSDCGMGREGMSRRHAFYKMGALVQGTNVVRKELGVPEAECLLADPKYSLTFAKK